MYMEIDGDEDASDGDTEFDPLTCVKDVTFTYEGQTPLKVTSYPFSMKKWCIGMQEDTMVECLVTFEVCDWMIFYLL